MGDFFGGGALFEDGDDGVEGDAGLADSDDAVEVGFEGGGFGDDG
jgi:hypothetical protein